jgi:hypothetical protein
MPATLQTLERPSALLAGRRAFGVMLKVLIK